MPKPVTIIFVMVIAYLVIIIAIIDTIFIIGYKD